MVLYHNSIPLAWNNYALFRFGELTQTETIEAALSKIVEALNTMQGKQPKMTIEAGVIIGHMFNAAIAAGHFELNEPNNTPKSKAFDFVTDAEAISVLMGLFSDSMPIEKKKAK